MKILAGVCLLLLLMQPLAYADNERYKEMQRWLNAYEAEEQANAEEKRKREQEEGERLRNCAEAKDRVENYETASGLYDFDNKGQRYFLDKEKRAEAEAWAQSEVERWCN